MATIRVRYTQGWKDSERYSRPTPRVAKILSQDYDVIKRECLALKALWEDPDFGATANSLYPSGKNQSGQTIEWKRPFELCRDPRMFVDGLSRLDINQGSLGNCWFLAATACLCSTENKDLFHRVVPKDNLFAKDYAGVFRFKFWQYGNWVEVVVDDRLPTIRGKLVFVHSPSNNEFWQSLVEKAYAKLNGSYEYLDGGNTSEAMEDFTGGVTQTFDLKKDRPKDLFVIMKSAFERDSLMGCSINPEFPDPTSGDTREIRLTNGLISGHAYSITSVKQITVREGRFNLVRVRNPWGNKDEWKGAWSDRSREWTMITEDDKKSLGLTFEDDGEFWMEFDDFVNNFSQLEICMMAPEHDTPSNRETSGNKRSWELTTHTGSWKRYVNAGGCRNYLNTFGTNPQYRLDVVDPDEDDDDNTGTIIVALMQKDRRKKIAELGAGDYNLSIGYGIYKFPPGHVGPLDVNFFRSNLSVAQSSTFLNAREQVGRYKLPPGQYLIVPSTFEPNEEGDFLLRIFSERKAPSSEMDEDTRLKDIDDQRDIEDDMVEEIAMRELFKETAGVDMVVDAYELRTILDKKFKPEFKVEGISLETARSMVAMLDLDHSGKLGYEEFKKLWMDLRRWKKVFLAFDVSKKSCLSAFELRAALNTSGYLVSNQTLKCIVMRYSDQKGYVQFDDFILCAVRLKTMFEIYKEMTHKTFRRADSAEFTLDQFVQTTMYS